MLTAIGVIGLFAACIAAWRLRERHIRREVLSGVQEAGIAMLCDKARQETSIELKAKLSSGVLRGAYKEAAMKVLGERGEA